MNQGKHKFIYGSFSGVNQAPRICLAMLLLCGLMVTSARAQQQRSKLSPKKETESRPDSRYRKERWYRRLESASANLSQHTVDALVDHNARRESRQSIASAKIVTTQIAPARIVPESPQESATHQKPDLQTMLRQRRTERVKQQAKKDPAKAQKKTAANSLEPLFSDTDKASTPGKSGIVTGLPEDITPALPNP